MEPCQKRNGDRIRRLERLIEISRSLNSTLSLRPLLYQIVLAAQEITDTEACSILLVDRKSGQLYFEEATNLPGVHSIVVPMEGSVAGWVVQTGQSLVVPDAQADPRFDFSSKADEQSTFTTRSILAIPLIFREQVIGVLEAINKQGGTPFIPEDVEMLAVLGDQAAVAVQNALLFQQSDLIAEIVHEMRTPLNSIIAYADLMRRPTIMDVQRLQFAEIIQDEAERISEMTNNFLELARLKSGRAALAQDLVEVSTVIRMAMDVLRPQADAKQIVFSIDVPPNLPNVRGDAQRLHQVMLNLLSNAIKYCRPGDNVTVSTRCQEDQLVVSVADTGPGIPTDALSSIFERFYRVPGAESQVVGTGLGLAITQQIVEAHGGQIGVESEEGEGATFTFTLPVQQ
ncbi:MAG TPA: GAF domain-containing sensor histidine kinase [Chloroflexi bacterium]|nr:GAF domain-containing sensor histidine kinase [Chloroflexota bacterium]